MRFAYLGSGSRGNSALVQHLGTTLMIDCGFNLTNAQRRLARLQVSPHDIDAVLVTHEHGDHISGVAALARRYNMPVWMTAGTRAGWKQTRGVKVKIFNAHEQFSVGDILVRPYPVPHDAREPSQFVLDDGQHRIGVLSDAGHVTPHMRESLNGCHGLMLECNHDVEMLANGPYPPALRERVGGDYGHLSNMQAAGLLRSIDTRQLHQLVIAHISAKNNTNALAQGAVSQALGCEPEWAAVADQEMGMDWRECGSWQ